MGKTFKISGILVDPTGNHDASTVAATLRGIGGLVDYSLEVEEIESLGEDDKIRVGDKVRVVNKGNLYANYREWVEKHVKDPVDWAKWFRGGFIFDGAIGVVKYLAPHGWRPENIAYVEIDGKCHMIGVNGLEKFTGEISIEQMRLMLCGMCESRSCYMEGLDNRCPLEGIPYSCNFLLSDPNPLTDEQIREAYALVFDEKGK